MSGSARRRSRTLRPGAVGGQSELGAVAAGLFEVVAEELVELDELGAVLLEPGGEALVEVGARGFGSAS